MDPSTVYTKTAKGALEIAGRSRSLNREQCRVLYLVDGKSSLADILAKMGRMSEARLTQIIDGLLARGLIRPVAEASSTQAEELGFASTILVAEADTQAFLEAQVEIERNRGGQGEAQPHGEPEAEGPAREDAEAHARAEAPACGLVDDAERPAQQEARAGARAEEEAEHAREELEELAREAQARLDEERARRQEEAARLEKERAEARRRTEALAAARRAAEEAARARETERAAAKAAAEKAAREEAEAALREVSDEPLFELRLFEAPAPRRIVFPSFASWRLTAFVSWAGVRRAVARTVAFGMAFVLIAAALVHFLPLGFLAGHFEVRLAQGLGEPVRVGTVRFAALPLPAWRLEDVAIGRREDVRIGWLSLAPEPGDWFEEVQRLREVTAAKVRVEAGSLPRLPVWLDRQSRAKYRLARVNLDDVRVVLPGVELDAFGGRLDIARGRLARAWLGTADGRAQVEVLPAEGSWRVHLLAFGWAPPTVPLRFDRLDVEATVREGSVDIASLFAEIYGGTVHGHGLVFWGEPAGGRFALELARIDLARALPDFTRDFRAQGRLSAKLRVDLAADRLAELSRRPRFFATFLVERGALGNLDLVRAINAPAATPVTGGETRFDDFTGHWEGQPGNWRLARLALRMGRASASGRVALENGALNGSLTTVLPTAGGTLSVPLVLSGNLATPVLRGTVRRETRQAQPPAP